MDAFTNPHYTAQIPIKLLVSPIIIFKSNHSMGFWGWLEVSKIFNPKQQNWDWQLHTDEFVASVWC